MGREVADERRVGRVVGFVVERLDVDEDDRRSEVGAELDEFRPQPVDLGGDHQPSEVLAPGSRQVPQVVCLGGGVVVVFGYFEHQVQSVAAERAVYVLHQLDDPGLPAERRRHQEHPPAAPERQCGHRAGQDRQERRPRGNGEVQQSAEQEDESADAHHAREEGRARRARRKVQALPVGDAHIPSGLHDGALGGRLRHLTARLVCRHLVTHVAMIPHCPLW
ncbi:hypothetical protein Q5530_34435 [Saccharothrix sp. BKS2]|uniref:hypothetical protein n=1 Tax=Saccharothrix sp. BKS2 TaxID=3064400 RepID=UPI0039EBC2B6